MLLGTDCAGIEAPAHALRNLKVAFNDKFPTEINEESIKMIKCKFPPEILHKDIADRDDADVPGCELYIAGILCQPFFIAGLKQGDEKGRGRCVATSIITST